MNYRQFVAKIRWAHVALAATIIGALGLHVLFWQAKFPDYTMYLDPWLTAMRQHGPGIVGSDFSNYHPPYLYLIWLISLLVPDNLSVIKLTGLFIDIAMGIAVYYLVLQVWHSRIKAALIAASALVLPTVIINSAAWGQCDALVTTFLLWSVAMALRKRFVYMWLFAATALAVKTQAIFIVPWLVYITGYYRQGVKGVMAGTLFLLILLALPVLAGHTVHDLVAYYLRDVQPMWGVRLLSWWCPNIMIWLPTELFDIGKLLGVTLFGIITAGFGFIGWRHTIKDRKLTLLLLATLSCLLAPFVLPQMHERYFYPAEVLLWVLAAGSLRWVTLALIMQAVTFTGMWWMFASDMSRDFTIHKVLSVFMFGIISIVAVAIVRQNSPQIRGRAQGARGILRYRTNEGITKT